ncbi:hypothetical protein Rhopal_003621-T1 [Rhodotorula paludigena]|uniref:Uncharacterized protein n=1 Tax=Rhodotorula paludigena TaxID=86838 RepID=A0AAV5GJK1_9BASI|nr:hypothetical protein Rhopal_003621-T1 [Rhodotorula paludigena]
MSNIEYTMSKASNELTEDAERKGEEAVYRPTEHDGLRKDGQPDKRVSSEHAQLMEEAPRAGFGGDKELAHEAGVAGGSKTAEDMAY